MSGRLGKGLDALISEVEDLEEDTERKKTNLTIPRSALKKAVEDGKKNPRVVVWSPKASIVLRVLKKTIPEFSISREASELLEEAVKKKYPDIWRKVEEELER